MFATIARSTRSTANADDIAQAAARWRRMTFWGLFVLFVPAIAYSLTKTPYGHDPRQAGTVVQATGHQWAWDITPSTVRVGQLVEIRVTGADVNHGFGVYDTNDRLVTQTQGMPGYTNVIRYVFTAPGTYRVRCLAYCGPGHHTMVSQLTFTTAP